MIEKFVEVEGGKVYCRMEGSSSEEIPLVILHGGPGYPSYYLENLEVLKKQRPVLFYDQLGCGRSQRPNNSKLWVLERFVNELEAVVTSFGLEKFFLLGHSTGTMLAVDYYFKFRKKVAGMVLASPVMNSRKYIEDEWELVKKLPQKISAILRNNDKNDPFYDQAYEAFLKVHMFQGESKLEEKSNEELGEQVYETMWGDNELNLTGNLREYDRSKNLSGISCPILFTCGRFDTATPKTVEEYHLLTPQSKMVIFENSAHMAHLEEPEKYIASVKNFLLLRRP